MLKICLKIGEERFKFGKIQSSEFKALPAVAGAGGAASGAAAFVRDGVGTAGSSGSP